MTEINEMVIAYATGLDIPDDEAIGPAMEIEIRACLAKPTEDRADDLIRAWVGGATHPAGAPRQTMEPMDDQEQFDNEIMTWVEESIAARA